MPAVVLYSGPKPSPAVYHISPALFASPASSHLSGTSPNPVPPSPYVLNHKRREFAPPPEVEVVEEEKVESFEVEEEKVETLEEVEEEEEGGLEGFCNPSEVGSVVSGSETEEGGGLRVVELGRSSGGLGVSEFYDATDEFSADGSNSQASPSHFKMEFDLRSLRLNLFEEIEKRKKAEDSLSHIQNQWKRMASFLSEMGLSFPPIPDAANTQQEIDSTMQLYQEFAVSKFVFEALERGVARAEAEEAAQSLIESKNNEIARLHDRLQYYEVVNREMSQRNQEAIELARQQRRKRRIKQRWIWGSIGLSLTMGVSLLGYTFMPDTSKGPDLTSDSNQSTDPSTQ